MIRCPCDTPPVGYWRMPDGFWIRAAPIETPEQIQILDGATGYVIACPDCHHVYARGTE